MATKPNTRGDAAAAARTDTDAPRRPRLLTRTTLLPAAGIGLVTALLAAQQHAPAGAAVVVGVTVALVVVGMIALRRGYRGE